VAQDPGRGTDSFARPTHGGVEEGECHPCQTSEAEEGSQGWTRPDRADPQQPSRVRVDRESVRHADGGPEVRTGEGGTLPEHVPDQSVEDGGRPLRPAAVRADWPLPPVDRWFSSSPARLVPAKARSRRSCSSGCPRSSWRCQPRLASNGRVRRTGGSTGSSHPNGSKGSSRTGSSSNTSTFRGEHAPAR